MLTRARLRIGMGWPKRLKWMQVCTRQSSTRACSYPNKKRAKTISTQVMWCVCSVLSPIVTFRRILATQALAQCSVRIQTSCKVRSPSSKIRMKTGKMTLKLWTLAARMKSRKTLATVIKTWRRLGTRLTTISSGTRTCISRQKHGPNPSQIVALRFSLLTRSMEVKLTLAINSDSSRPSRSNMWHWTPSLCI